MDTSISIQEKDLELVVREKTLGSLTTNAKQIRDFVKSALSRYDISNYGDDNIDQAKRDKAALNKAAKALNSKRIEIEKEFMKPFGEFKEVVTETVKLIGECSAKIDLVIKENELRYKQNKKNDIRTYFDGLNVNLVDFEKIFKQEWLNKTMSMKSVCNDIDTILARIDSEITSLKRMNPEDFDALRAYYMDALSLSSTLEYAKRLQEQRERAKQQEEAKKISEEVQPQAEVKIEVEPVEILEEGNMTPIKTIEIQPEDTILYTRAFKITATKEQIIALSDFMNDNNIDFERIDL